ncbi:hypothetical protein HHL14_07315 [Paraburkholderia sp. G-4-1-8]|uniref:Uncharacterized protein n=1 Tax=Paraburkholderia antibiotica TaxID=2728839 RepID=A0A7X9ZVY9_9BURK|nr:hypothetical protein [Paraburkholderia antibiotica]
MPEFAAAHGGSGGLDDPRVLPGPMALTARGSRFAGRFPVQFLIFVLSQKPAGAAFHGPHSRARGASTVEPVQPIRNRYEINT